MGDCGSVGGESINLHLPDSSWPSTVPEERGSLRNRQTELKAASSIFLERGRRDTQSENSRDPVSVRERRKKPFSLLEIWFDKCLLAHVFTANTFIHNIMRRNKEKKRLACFRVRTI